MRPCGLAGTLWETILPVQELDVARLGQSLNPSDSLQRTTRLGNSRHPAEIANAVGGPFADRPRIEAPRLGTIAIAPTLPEHGSAES